MSESDAEINLPTPIDKIDFSLYGPPYGEGFGPPVNDGNFDFYESARSLATLHPNKTTRLRDWLQKIRPEALYYQPQIIFKLASKSPNLVAEKTEEGGVTSWNFHLNNNVFPSADQRKQNIRLTRGSEGRNAAYLVIGFSAEYEQGKVLFKPETANHFGSSGRELEVEIVKLLGLSKTEIEQELNIEIVDREVGKIVTFDLKD